MSLPYVRSLFLILSRDLIIKTICIEVYETSGIEIDLYEVPNKLSSFVTKKSDVVKGIKKVPGPQFKIDFKWRKGEGNDA